MLTKEQLEKVVPKTYDDAMRDFEVGHYLMIMAIYCKLIDRGIFKDFDDVMKYQKDLWESALRTKIIEECLKGKNNESN